MENLVMTRENLDRMKHVEKEVERVALKYRENTEAAIVAGAMMRVVRRIIDNYPEPAKGQLVEGAIAFLQERDVEGELAREAEQRIILPRN